MRVLSWSDIVSANEKILMTTFEAKIKSISFGGVQSEENGETTQQRGRTHVIVWQRVSLMPARLGWVMWQLHWGEAAPDQTPGVKTSAGTSL